MKTLSENWITEGWIDLEYKKYILLDYLQDVTAHYKAVKLYPPLADLIEHYARLKSFSENRDQLKASFPKKLEGPDFKTMKLNYKPEHVDDDMMQQLEEIVDYCLPQLKTYIEEGKSIYDFLENEMDIEPVGLSPIYQKEGYAMLSSEKSKDVYIYRYKIKLVHSRFDTFKGIMMHLVKIVSRSLVNTIEQIKLDLIRCYQDLPNPATYRIHSKHQIPIRESFLPISKRMLLRVVE